MTALSRLGPVERSPLWDQAYAALRDSLLGGRFAPGERLLLRDIADQLGISLTPVRDAVNRLVAERVLERGSVGQGGGATVPRLTADQFGQLMAVRASLEPAATMAAVPHATVEKLDEIEAALVAMQQKVNAQRPEGYLEAHHRFHFGIYALCRMPIMLEIIEGAWLRCAPTLRLGLPDHVPSLKRFPFHVAALQALRTGDGQAAADAIRADIHSASDEICAQLERTQAR